jgi:hypothetical protein
MLEGVGVLFVQKNVQGYGWLGYEDMPHIAPEEELSIAAEVQLRSIEDDLAYLLDLFDVPALPRAST